MLLAGLLAGASGAVLIAALVLGRGGQAEGRWAELASLDDGGVLVMRTEVYQRHGEKADVIAAVFAGGDIGVYPERRVDETWMLLGRDGEVLDMSTVTWINNGELLQRVRIEDRTIITERPALSVSERRQIGGSVIGFQQLPSDFRQQIKDDIEGLLADASWQVAEVRTPGMIVLTRPRTISAGALGGASYSVPYYGDLQVREALARLTFAEGYWPIDEELWVVLLDGSRVLVESRRTTIEARGAEEWDGFVARVWGD